jgi:hypothetical protein
MAAIANAFNSDLFYFTEPWQLVSNEPEITDSSSRKAVSFSSACASFDKISPPVQVKSPQTSAPRNLQATRLPLQSNNCRAVSSVVEHLVYTEVWAVFSDFRVRPRSPRGTPVFRGKTSSRRTITTLSHVIPSLTDVVTYSVTNGLTSRNEAGPLSCDAVRATKTLVRAITDAA